MNDDTVVQRAQNPRMRLFLIAGLVLSMLGLGVVFAQSTPAAPADCSGAHRVDKKLPNGARWQLCWEIREREGLSINKVIYTPRGHKPQLVLGSTRLAALHVPYDPGEPRFDDIGGMGQSLLRIVKQDCPSGELRAEDGSTFPTVCVQTRSRGLAYRYGDEESAKTLQGSELVLFSVAQIGWYTYVTEYSFTDDGAINPRLGASGSLTPEKIKDPKYGWPVGVRSPKFSPNHSHIAYWRVDFDLQGSKSDVVEQFDFDGPGKAKVAMSKRALTKEAAGAKAPMRWWRVVDPTQKNSESHQVSWEIVNDATAQFRGPKAAEGWTHNDVYFTNYHECEGLVQNNPLPGCKRSVDQYVDGEKLTDLVAWVGVSFHHVPRDEDEDPMPMHWQGFSIVPRDVTATSPLPQSTVPAPFPQHDH